MKFFFYQYIYFENFARYDHSYNGRPGLVFDQVCSQVFDKFVRVCDTLSTSFRLFFENLVANRIRFAGLCAC